MGEIAAFTVSVVHKGGCCSQNTDEKEKVKRPREMHGDMSESSCRTQSDHREWLSTFDCLSSVCGDDQARGQFGSTLFSLETRHFSPHPAKETNRLSLKSSNDSYNRVVVRKGGNPTSKNWI